MQPLMQAQRRIGQAGDALAELEAKVHAGEVPDLAELRKRWKRLQGEFEGANLEPEDAINQAEQIIERCRSLGRETVQKRPWFRNNPRAFALLIIATLVAAQVVVAMLFARAPGRLALHGVGLVIGFPAVYVGLTRWADPSILTSVTTYAEGRTHGGERVTMATGSKSVRSTPFASIIAIVGGLLAWGFFAALGTLIGRV